MEDNFEITFMEKLESIVGLQITYNDNGSITITEPKQIQKLKAEFFPDNEVPIYRTPMAKNWSEHRMNQSKCCDIDLWMKRLGTMLFILKTRSESAYAMSKHSTRTHVCTEKDMAALKRTAAYIIHTKDLGITFHAGDKAYNEAAITFCAAVDVAHAVYESGQGKIGTGMKLGDINSDSGMYYVKSSKNHGTVPLSSCESELKGGVEMVKDAYAERGLYEELGFKQTNPIKIYEDNQPLINVTKDMSKSSKRMKHVQQQIEFVLQAVKNNVVVMTKIKGDQHCVDLLTKSNMSDTAHWKHTEAILGKHPSITLAKQRLGISNNSTNVIEESDSEDEN